MGWIASHFQLHDPFGSLEGGFAETASSVNRSSANEGLSVIMSTFNRRRGSLTSVPGYFQLMSGKETSSGQAITMKTIYYSSSVTADLVPQ